MINFARKSLIVLAVAGGLGFGRQAAQAEAKSNPDSSAVFSVLYSSSEAGVISSQCLSGFLSAYQNINFNFQMVPVARLFKAASTADILLCIPNDIRIPGYVYIDKGEVEGRFSFFVQRGLKEERKLGLILGMTDRADLKPALQATNSMQLINAWKAGRINAVYIVEEDFTKMLSEHYPQLKYDIEPSLKFKLRHMVKEASRAKFLQNAD